MPDPLHPALVHFPIVLILLGAAAAIVAACWRGGQVPRFAALLLALGALGAWAAVETGESSGGLLERGSPEMEGLVDAHETWAKRTFALAGVAAVASVAAALAGRCPRLARGVAVMAAIASAAAAYAVYETGQRGGALVYRHAAGVEVLAHPPPGDGDTATHPRTAQNAEGKTKDRDPD
ncbi:MAG: hypothetical protein KGS61_04170 [Verrucomicrobia bacterium]|nr:hypothetical protein [Verrucomicrobiota bacterium]